MNAVILVHGTWSRHADWHRPGSPLWRALQARGYLPVEFLWSGYCGGVPGPVIVPPSTTDLKGDLELWRSEGEKLWYFCRVLGLDRPRVLSHSHGLQVVAFAAVAGQEFEVALSLSGPVREDMAWWRQKARPRIGRWIHVTDPTGDDQVILAGEVFDGALGWHFDLPEADLNIHSDGAGHSGLLDPFDEGRWAALGLWSALA